MRSFLCCILLSLPVLALDINDTMTMHVLDVLKSNQVSIDRGFSDNIHKGDHLKINDSQGYKARGIVIFTRENFSILKLYRIIENDSLSRDNDYILTSMKQSLIAPHMRKYLKADFEQNFADFVPRKSSKPNAISIDLPQKTTAQEVSKAISK